MKEIRPTGPSGVVGRQSRGVGVRRMYTAQIVGGGWPMTVAMYQGAGAEKAGPSRSSEMSSFEPIAGVARAYRKI
jgi:hypothetical protein